MGVIISGVRMISEPYNYILQKSEDVRVKHIRSSLNTVLNHCFEALKPLSYKYKVVCNMNEEGESVHDLCIGSWLRTRWGGSSRSRNGYGSIVNDIVPYILEYGDKLKPHVRGPIKDDFADLVDLTREVKEYADVSEVITIPPKTIYKHEIRNNRLKVSEKEVTELRLSTNDPFAVVMASAPEDDNRWRVTINYVSSIAVIEDVIDNVVELYKIVDAKLSIVKDHNRQITTQVEQIAAPHILMRALK